MLAWLKNLIKKDSPEEEEPVKYPFSQWVTFGCHMYRHAGEKADVEFIDQETGRRKTIIDKEAVIVDFPGIIKEEKWMNSLESEESLEPVIHFRTSFEKWDEEKYIMLWEIQPDGRYWEDEDGFGGTSDSEIQLYTFLDENGDFTGPFQVYNVGRTHYLPENT